MPLLDALYGQPADTSQLEGAIGQASDRITQILQRNRGPSIGDIGRAALRAQSGIPYGQGLAQIYAERDQRKMGDLNLALQNVDLMQKRVELAAQRGGTGEKFKFLWDAYTQGMEPEQRIQFMTNLQSDPEEFGDMNAEQMFVRAAQGVDFSKPLDPSDRYEQVGGVLLDISGESPVPVYEAPPEPDNTLVEVYDPTSPTQTRLVPRAQAAGMATGTVPEVDNTKTFNQEDKLRGEFTVATKPIREAQLGLEKVRAASNTATAQGDIALIFGFMKTLDPNSTVREGEFATAENSGGVPTRIWNLYNSIINGERLTPEQRQQFVSAAEEQFAVYQRQYDSLSKYYGDLAGQYGVDAGRIVVPLTAVDAAAAESARLKEKYGLE